MGRWSTRTPSDGTCAGCGRPKKTVGMCFRCRNGGVEAKGAGRLAARASKRLGTSARPHPLLERQMRILSTVQEGVAAAVAAGKTDSSGAVPLTSAIVSATDCWRKLRESAAANAEAISDDERAQLAIDFLSSSRATAARKREALERIGASMGGPVLVPDAAPVER